MKDMHSALTAVAVIGPAVLAADNTPAALDLQGYNAAEIVLAIGIGGITFDDTNKVEFKLSHGDTSTASEHAAVAQGDVLGVTVATGGVIKALTAAHAAAAVYRVGYKGGKRYVSVLADFSGTHGTGTPISVLLLKGAGIDNPQDDQA